MILLLALAQVAAPSAAAPPTTRASTAVDGSFSVLAQPCGRAGQSVGDDVVVCGDKADPQRLPLPGERVPSGPVASNPYLRPDVALAAEGTPCAASQRGCQVGIGGPVVMAAVQGIATAISDGIADAKVRKARRRDDGRRVPIPLD